jgi:RNA polymerase sigma-70 factor (ECF subfamily)
LDVETARLLLEARAGSRAALDTLYERHRGRLLAFAASRMTPALSQFISPEDIVQETHLESARKIDAFEAAGPAAFYRWLVRIAEYKISEAGRERRAKKRALGPLDEEPPAEETSASGRLARDERHERLREALASLPEAQAEAVRLRYLEGLSLAETAARLDRTVAAVKALVGRGLTALGTRVPGTR